MSDKATLNLLTAKKKCTYIYNRCHTNNRAETFNLRDEKIDRIFRREEGEKEKKKKNNNFTTVAKKIKKQTKEVTTTTKKKKKKEKIMNL